MGRYLLFFFMIAIFSHTAFGQHNLLLNSDAKDQAKHWKPYGEAEVGDFDGDSVFILRNGGYFVQDVKLSPGSNGKYALLIGKTSAQRINPKDSITGRPYLYGYMIFDYKPAGSKINTYLQGQRMGHQSLAVDEWSKVYGIFRVADGTEVIRFFLKQASRREDPHDGSEARFDNLGLYLFDSETDAASFAERY